MTAPGFPEGVEYVGRTEGGWHVWRHPDGFPVFFSPDLDTPPAEPVVLREEDGWKSVGYTTDVPPVLGSAP